MSFGRYLEGAFMIHEADHWVPLLLAAGIPVGEINNLEKSLANPQIVERDMVLPLVNEDGDVIRVAGNPVKMSRTSKTSHEYPPKLGAQTAEILGHVLGADADEISNSSIPVLSKSTPPKMQRKLTWKMR